MSCEMYKVCKIRIYPNKNQERIIKRTLGACRWIYNHYLGYNIDSYKKGYKLTTAYEFSKLINELKKYEDNYTWLNDISSKAIKDSIINAEKAFKRFFKGKSKYPRFKSKKDKVNSFFIIRDNIHFNTGKKNIINLPILKKVRIRERSYLPDNSLLSSGRIILDHNKYYVSFIYQVEKIHKEILTEGIGLDLGISKYLTIYRKDDKSYAKDNFIYDNKYKDLEEKIYNIQQVISNKANINYIRSLNEYMKTHEEQPDEKQENLMKRRSYATSNIRKLQNKVTSLYIKKVNYSKDKVNKLVYMIAKTKPKYITIEDLQVKNMIANIKNKDNNHHELHRYIQDSMFRYFRTRLEQKCKEFNIELRIANKYFASSKKCSNCGNKKKDLTLEDRMYICPECGMIINRDLNAAINLCNLNKYKVI